VSSFGLSGCRWIGDAFAGLDVERVAVGEECVEGEDTASGWRGLLAVGTADRGKSDGGCVGADHDGDGGGCGGVRWIEGADEGACDGQ